MDPKENEEKSKPLGESVKSDADYNDSKKSNKIILFKILVPAIAVGSIIGKGGEAIVQLQNTTGAKIKLSRADEFYPGTLDRVCLIQGTFEGVSQMHYYIIDRVYERPDNNAIIPESLLSSMTNNNNNINGVEQTGIRSKDEIVSSTVDHENSNNSGTLEKNPSSCNSNNLTANNTWNSKITLPWERHKQVKILVPNCTAGLVIGKGGSYVAEIKKKSGAYIQISQNSPDITLVERSITIAGTASEIKLASRMVLTKIAEDPQSSSCPQISYINAEGPIASAHPIGSPFAIPTASYMQYSPTGEILLNHMENTQETILPSTRYSGNNIAFVAAASAFIHQQQQHATFPYSFASPDLSYNQMQALWQQNLRLNILPQSEMVNSEYLTRLPGIQSDRKMLSDPNKPYQKQILEAKTQILEGTENLEPSMPYFIHPMFVYNEEPIMPNVPGSHSFYYDTSSNFNGTSPNYLNDSKYYKTFGCNNLQSQFSNTSSSTVDSINSSLHMGSNTNQIGQTNNAMNSQTIYDLTGQLNSLAISTQSPNVPVSFHTDYSPAITTGPILSGTGVYSQNYGFIPYQPTYRPQQMTLVDQGSLGSWTPMNPLSQEVIETNQNPNLLWNPQKVKNLKENQTNKDGLAHNPTTVLDEQTNKPSINECTRTNSEHQ